jgi:hypothetical protein
MGKRLPNGQESLGTLYPYWEREGTHHIGHSKHLCDMVQKGEVDLQTIKELTRNPRFICRKCGRSAVRGENLCEPVPL